MPRAQFTLRALLVAMLVVGAFFGGIRFERERQRRADVAADLAAVTTFDDFVYIAAIDPNYANGVSGFLEKNGIVSIIEGSIVYGVSVPPNQEARAISLLRADAASKQYWVEFK